MLMCPLCEIEWDGCKVGPACPDCGNTRTRSVDYTADYVWKANAATTLDNNGKWALR